MACEEVTAANEALIAALTSPEEVQGDAGRVKQRSVSDLIQAANYLAARCAGAGNGTGNGRMGLRFTRLVPDGTVNSRHCRDFNRCGC